MSSSGGKDKKEKEKKSKLPTDATYNICLIFNLIIFTLKDLFYNMNSLNAFNKFIHCQH